jgi:2,3-bisphosphoglycerate-independent phosphoglycerate mutase
VAGHEETLKAVCTPPHDITGQPVAGYLPQGEGSGFLRELMKKSEMLLADHAVNIERKKDGRLPATTIWLFWASGQLPAMPAFQQAFGESSAYLGRRFIEGLGIMAGWRFQHR